MINKKYLKLIRSRNREYNNFIYDTIAERIIDSLDLFKVSFKDILEIGVNDDVVYEYIKSKFPNSNYTSLDITKKRNIKKRGYNVLNVDFDDDDLFKDKYDLIHSNFLLHLIDNFEGFFKKIHTALKSNGFFIASIPDSNNIKELVDTMYQTDLELYEGVYQRINPTKEIEYILNILKKQNFDIPTISSNVITIEYENFSNLLSEIKNTNNSYCYLDKKQNFENKNYFNCLKKNYKKKFYNGKYIINIKFNVISAWKK